MKKVSLTINVLFLLLLFGLFAGCSKDDGDNGGDTIITPSEVNQLELVTIQMPSTLSSGQYSGTFNQAPISLIAVDDNNLVFVVPPSAVGESTLNIESLDISLNYNVHETVLTATPDEEMTSFFDITTSFISDIETETNEDAEIANEYIAAFNDYYSSLDDNGKTQIATYYKANRDLFENIYNEEENLNRVANFNNINTQLLKHKVATFAFSTGVALVILAPEPVEKALGTVIAVIAWKKSKGYLSGLMTAKLRKINVAIGELLSDINRSSQTSLTFVNAENRSFPLNIQQRDIESNDNGSENEGLSNFFGSHDLFSTGVDKLNVAIEFVNDNLFFSNIPLIPVYNMPAQQAAETVEISETVFESLSFSISDEQVELTSLTYTDGMVNITLTVNDAENLDVDYIESQLQYTYQDELNTISGSFPVTISLMGEPSIFTDAAIIKSIRAMAGADNSDPRWDSQDENEVRDLLIEKGCTVVNYRVTSFGVTSSTSLTTLPETLGNMDQLKTLNLHSNALTSLPASIANLTLLEELHLHGNQLTSIPSEIESLENLKILNLHANQLTSLPEEVYNLSNLEALIISYNDLTEISASIGNLTNLTHFEIGYYGSTHYDFFEHNTISTLPASIGNLSNLSIFYAGGVGLTSLPPEIGNLSNLAELELANNNLTTLPSEIGGLTSGQNLNLNGNANLSSIPVSIINSGFHSLLVMDCEALLCLPSEVWAHFGNNVTLNSNTGMQYGDINCSN